MKNEIFIHKIADYKIEQFTCSFREYAITEERKKSEELRLFSKKFKVIIISIYQISG